MRNRKGLARPNVSCHCYGDDTVKASVRKASGGEHIISVERCPDELIAIWLDNAQALSLLDSLRLSLGYPLSRSDNDLLDMVSTCSIMERASRLLKEAKDISI